MEGRRTFTVVASVALACCLVMLPLAGCFDNSGSTDSDSANAVSAEQTSQAASDASQGGAASDSSSDATAAQSGDAQDSNAEPAEVAAAESAPTLQTTSSSVTIPVDFFDILGISKSQRQEFLTTLGATDIAENEDGSYVVNLSSDDYSTFADHAYAAIQEKITSATTDGTYTSVSSVDYDETFATVVVVLSTKEIPQRDLMLGSNLGRAANIYQQIANLPVSCDVIVMNSEGEQLSETLYTGTATE